MRRNGLVGAPAGVKRWVALALAFSLNLTFDPAVHADVATGCIKLDQVTRTTGLEVQQFTNTCGQSVGVYWCHVVGTDPKAVCGSREKGYFTSSMTIKSGESMSNQYSLPANTAIDFKACWGESRAIDNGDGTLSCTAPAISDVATEVLTTCGITSVAFVITSPKPGIFRIKSQNYGSYTYNRVKNGEPHELDMQRVVKTVCGGEFSKANQKNPTVTRRLQRVMMEMIKTHAEKVETTCDQRYSAESCKGYRRAHIGIRG